MPTKAPVKEPCSPRPASSEKIEASRTGSDLPPFLAMSEGELQRLAFDRDGEPHRAVGVEPNGLGEREAQPPVGIIGLAAQDRQRAPCRLAPYDGEKMKLVLVVVGRDSRRLLKVLRPEIELGLRAVGEVFLPPGDEGLLEPRADRFAPDEPEPAGPRRKREDALGIGRAQPLKFRRQSRG